MCEQGAEAGALVTGDAPGVDCQAVEVVVGTCVHVKVVNAAVRVLDQRLPFDEVADVAARGLGSHLALAAIAKSNGAGVADVEPGLQRPCLRQLPGAPSERLEKTSRDRRQTPRHLPATFGEAPQNKARSLTSQNDITTAKAGDAPPGLALVVANNQQLLGLLLVEDLRVLSQRICGDAEHEKLPQKFQVQVPTMGGLWLQKPYLSRLLKLEASNSGHLDPPGVFARHCLRYACSFIFVYFDGNEGRLCGRSS